MSNSIIFHRFSTFGWGDTAHENVFRCSYLESKTEPIVAKAQDYMGGTPHRKTNTGRGEHRTCFLDWVNNWGVRGGHRTYFVVEGSNWGEDTAQHWLSLIAKFHVCITLPSGRFWWGLFLLLLLTYLLVKFSWVCKFGVEFDKNMILY